MQGQLQGQGHYKARRVSSQLRSIGKEARGAPTQSIRSAPEPVGAAPVRSGAHPAATADTGIASGCCCCASLSCCCCVCC